jgi:hypothetical protein
MLFGFYGLAVGLTLAPDFIDLTLKGRAVGGEHHSIPTHWPVLPVVVASVIGFCSVFWGVFFGSILLLHYAHDSAQRGTGIEWLAPWSRQRYTFFDGPRGQRSAPRHLWYAIPDDEMSLRNMPTTQWLERHYLRWTKTSISGLVTLTIALLLLTLWR